MHVFIDTIAVCKRIITDNDVKSVIETVCWLTLGCVGCIAIATSHIRMYMFYIQVYAAIVT